MQLLGPLASAAFLAALTLSAAALTPAVMTPPATTPAANGDSERVRPAPAAWVLGRDAGPALPSAGVSARGSRTRSDPDNGDSFPTKVAPRQRFGWPISPRPEVRRRFEQPRRQWLQGHRGVDLLAVAGQPVLSAGEGVVAFSGVIAGRGVITIRHPGGLRTTYEPVDARLASGSTVHRGDGIGVVAPTSGHCLPLSCLHWGAIMGGRYRDPLSLLGFGQPILLPLG